MNLGDLKNKNIHVIGISGTEGSNLALFLISLGCRNLTGHDFTLKAHFKKNYQYFHQDLSKKVIDQQIYLIKKRFKTINYQPNYLKNIHQAEIIFTSSSWFRYKVNQPLKKLKSHQLFGNWYNLLLEFYQGTLIGVTGTAGKGTTTHLIYNILKAAKKKVYLVGDSWQNINLYKIIKAPFNSFTVAELSNRTLFFAKYSKKSPKIAIITNITKNHLDDHQNSFKRYIATKREIAQYQSRNDFLILNSLNEQTRKLKGQAKAKKIFYSEVSPEKSLIKNKEITGNHLKSDAVAAIKVAKLLKIKRTDIQKGLNKFKARSGRMQFIRKIGNISFINDGASTRPEVTIEAVKSFPKKKVNLILEGYRFKPDKKQFMKLINTIITQEVKNIAVSGKITNFIYPLLKRTPANIFKTNNLTQSVKLVYSQAKNGEIILLSPACESFGEFKNYRERIAKFNKVVNKINA